MKDTCAAWCWRVLLEILELFRDPLRSHAQTLDRQNSEVRERWEESLERGKREKNTRDGTKEIRSDPILFFFLARKRAWEVEMEMEMGFKFLIMMESYSECRFVHKGRGWWLFRLLNFKNDPGSLWYFKKRNIKNFLYIQERAWFLFYFIFFFRLQGLFHFGLFFLFFKWNLLYSKKDKQ